MLVRAISGETGERDRDLGWMATRANSAGHHRANQSGEPKLRGYFRANATGMRENVAKGGVARRKHSRGLAELGPFGLLF